MASVDSKAFAGKFLQKLGKISREEIEAFLSRLQNERSFLETILNHLLEGVVVTDPNGRVLFLNRAARGLLGLGAQRKIVGGPLLDLLPPGDLYEALREYDPLRDKIHAAEVTVDGPEERIFNVTLIPVHDDRGVLVCVVTFLRDLTIQRHEEEQRIQAERLASLATLTAGVAHEIKNPLNALGIHAHLLRKALSRPDAERPREEMTRMKRSADILIEEIDRLARVVDDFLQAARPTKPQFQMKNVNDILRRLADLMEPEVAQRGIKVEMELDAQIPSSRIDEIQLLQAFRNVVKNSIEAIDHPTGLIRIGSRLTPESILVEFQDNGTGIPREQLQKIFEPYVTTKFSGTGLGLMVVYRIVTEHRGFISVRSEAAEGTTIRIALPLGPRPQQLLPDKTGGWRAPESADVV